MKAETILRNEYLRDLRDFFERFKEHEFVEPLPEASNICQDYFRQYVPSTRDVYVEVRIHNDMIRADVGVYANKNRAEAFGRFLEREDISNRLNELHFERHSTDTGKEYHVHGYVPLAADAGDQREAVCRMMKSLIEIVEWYVNGTQSEAFTRLER